MSLILENALIFDGLESGLKPGHVLIEGQLISEVSDTPLHSNSARRINLQGRTLMPGLIDAHFHAMLVDIDLHGLDHLPSSFLVQKARINLENALARGFTTIRDAGGADYGFCMAIQAGLIRGPRLFISGRVLSQTGGHGDMRKRTEVSPCGCGQVSRLSRLVDGPDAMRLAAREELRAGAAQIKIFASGGVTSPSDPIGMLQFCDEEIQVAVTEAARLDTYVMAHAYTDAAISRAVDLGVRSIEHGNFLSLLTAHKMAAKQAFLVPTLITYNALVRDGAALGLPQVSVDKVKEVEAAGMDAIAAAVEAGVRIGFGTDLIGSFHDRQSMELSLRCEVQDSWSVLRSATSENAALLNQVGKLGVVQPGAIADLLAVNGDISRDLSCLQEQGKHIDMILQAGQITKLTMN